MAKRRNSTPLMSLELIERYYLLQPTELRTEKIKKRFIIEQQNYEKQFEIIKLLQSRIKTKEKIHKILDIGCGIGSFLYRSAILGFKAFGIEPSYDQVRVSTEYQSADYVHLINAEGEYLPFSDNTFDCVVSMSVLEHCESVKGYITEAVRVLKKGGAFYLVFPNYNFFWEPHYDVYWIPFMPFILKKCYLRFCGRNPQYLNTINFVTPRSVRKTLETNNVDIRDLSSQLFQKRLRNPDKIGVPNVSKKLSFLKKKPISELLQWLPKVGIYYPVVWLIQKR